MSKRARVEIDGSHISDRCPATWPYDASTRDQCELDIGHVGSHRTYWHTDSRRCERHVWPREQEK